MPLATKRPMRAQPLTVKSIVAPSPTDGPTPVRVLDIPFEMRPLAAENGVFWDPKRKTYITRNQSLPAYFEPFRSQQYSWERWQEDQLNGLEATDDAPQRTITMKPHQGEAVKRILAAVAADRSGFLNADDVGLGKTFETWQAVLEMDWAETVLIVCPLAVVAHWRRTIQWMGNKGKRIVVINYDRLKKLFEVPDNIPLKARRGKKRVRKVRTQKGIAKFGTAVEFDMVIFDESHRLGNVETARSKLALKLSDPADFIMWLSATAGQDPLRLAYLAPLLSESSGIRSADLNDFEDWCRKMGFGVEKGKFGKWSWVGDGKDLDPRQRAAANDDLERMRGLLFDGKVPLGIRRSPSDIAGWPEINRILLPVDLDAEDRGNYAKAWSEFRDHLGLESRGVRDSTNGLVARLRFRQKASLLRTASTLDIALDLLSQGQQVAVSVEFHDTLNILLEAFRKERYGVSIIHGKISPAQKEAERLDFQHGRNTVCLYTVTEGISLHQGEYNDAPRSNLIHDLRWNYTPLRHHNSLPEQIEKIAA